ncbi:MAG: hypothetical protein ACREGB_01635 [Candidatus Saccharimonadales bacterium]
MSEDRTVLDFGDAWQEALFGHILADHSFALKCMSNLKFEYFVDPILSGLVKQSFQFYKDYQRPVKSSQELLTVIYQIHPDKATRDKYELKLAKCAKSAEGIGRDVIANSLTGWIQLTLFKGAMQEAGRLYNKRQFDEGVKWLKKKMVEIDQTNFYQDETVRFDDLKEFLLERTLDMTNCCTLGHPDFDEMLRKGAKINSVDPQDVYNIGKLSRGCLIPGDTTIMMGPVNTGKTTTLLTIINANLIMAKDVLYITHEMKFEEHKSKLIQSCTGMDGIRLSNPSDPEVARRLLAAQYLFGHLTYLPYVKPGAMYVENVIEKITELQERKIAITGKGYDLLLCDYPGKLKSREYKGKQSSSWDEKAYVYDQFVQVTEKYRFHSILPVQTNREGFKANRTEGNRLVDMGDVADAFGIMATATNVITINRTPADVQRGTIKMHIVKSRSSMTNWVFVAKSNFGCARMYELDKPAFTIHPSESDSATSDRIVAQRLGEIDRKNNDPIQPQPVLPDTTQNTVDDKSKV